MRLKRIELTGFKSFARKTVLDFSAPITAIVGPNGSGKSNVAEAMRFVLGEQSIKSMRGKRGEDLIWNGSKNVGRVNHASVFISFDNVDRIFDIDFDEVIIGREVFRDGANNYTINGTSVRLKDIVELLSVAHIGSSAHHIISQGETDRFLFSSIRERRVMIEDALGLRIYQYKINESEKKLKKTEENVREVSLLRKELAPRLSFLKKQVERIERVRKLRGELSGDYAEYLKREELYVQWKKRAIEDEARGPKEALRLLDEKIQNTREVISAGEKDRAGSSEILKLETDIRSVRAKKDEFSRALGRLEGMIEFEARRREREKQTAEKIKETFVPLFRVREMVTIAEGLILEASGTEDMGRIKYILERIKEHLRGTLEAYTERKEAPIEEKKEDNEEEMARLRHEKENVESEMRGLREEEDRVQALYSAMKAEMEKEKDATRDIERELFAMMSERSDAAIKVNTCRSRMYELEHEEQDFKSELSEAGVLIGREILNYGDLSITEEEVISEEREKQRERKKKIERMKIRIEELGVGGGEDVEKEYKDVIERDQFLERELADLVKTAESLSRLIAELSEKLTVEFKEGLEKINRQFQEYFTVLFGGGTASLKTVIPEKKKKNEVEEVLEATVEPTTEDMEEEEEGLDINISLPHKRLRGIQMLSGGERTLTSIALLFAVSQVNPPPFLVLDETDAALDEANSKKYGMMLETLSKTSQLAIITHNRETMSHAGIIYGVTVGIDCVSKILSIKFEDAENMMAR
ncbi:MAG: AAA family ATPase [Candidatus Paceibacterota bacterium]|jgi:chromosome segregation protein|nr:AAA family ATPase [Candidatus Paceibacterota bacterium]